MPVRSRAGCWDWEALYNEAVISAAKGEKGSGCCLWQAEPRCASLNSLLENLGEHIMRKFLIGVMLALVLVHPTRPQWYMAEMTVAHVTLEMVL